MLSIGSCEPCGWRGAVWLGRAPAPKLQRGSPSPRLGAARRNTLKQAIRRTMRPSFSRRTRPGGADTLVGRARRDNRDTAGLRREKQGKIDDGSTGPALTGRQVGRAAASCAATVAPPCITAPL